jgi:MoaA/NifB/PqqE/SkfB family radical SAM enzyme
MTTEVTDWVQQPPFAVQVEPTEGCNLYCDFCGLQGIRTLHEKNFKFMTVETAWQIALGMQQAKWTARVEFAMHGEPTMNPQLVEIVRIFRSCLPRNQLMVTSNGGGLLAHTTERVRALFQAGLNILALDDYDGVKIVPKIVERLLVSGVAEDYPLIHYPQDGLDKSPHHRWPASTQVIIAVQDITKAEEGSHSSLNNHCGAAMPLNNKAAGKRCAKPFRELSIRWDGSVAGCCNDWRGVYKIGNAVNVPVGKLWQASPFQAMRRKLYHGQRDFGACKGCDALSYRVGLLPDKLGQVKLALPTKEDDKWITKAVAGGPLAVPVARPWEK